jgi:hypothetical protein
LCLGIGDDPFVLEVCVRDSSTFAASLSILWQRWVSRESTDLGLTFPSFGAASFGAAGFGGLGVFSTDL